MKTTSITIQNLCVPCGCACRYCLLRSCKQAEGVDYERGLRIARRFAERAKDKGYVTLPDYCIGYCAEYPQIADTIAFNRSVGFIGARILQVNGIAIRTAEETDRHLRKLKAAGLQQIDTTFYGDREYHDAFAARSGDYDFMFLLARRASAAGIVCAPSVPVTKDNIPVLPDLMRALEAIPGIGKIHAFIPDYRGRGALLEPVRITRDDADALPETVKAKLNLSRYKTQAQWLSLDRLPEYTRRSVIVSLSEDNIRMFERMTCDEILSYAEALDDAFYRAIPSVQTLAEMYDDRQDRKLYRLRDLFWMWQQRYIKENAVDVYDVTDERFCSTVRS